MTQLYDTIGKNYADYRRPDPRIAAMIMSALGDAARIVNVGAGTGNYEPEDRYVVAVEPSEVMIGQRRRGTLAVRASAMALPFPDKSFDAAMAILTVHHWPDLTCGLTEMARVAERIVILTWEPSTSASWLTRDYFPEILEHDLTLFPLLRDYPPLWASMETVIVPIPRDCTDGFLEAYWCRPEMLLDPGARAAISSFARLTDVQSRLDRLRRDLDDGTWEHRNGHLRERTELDLGYRLMIGTAG